MKSWDWRKQNKSKISTQRWEKTDPTRRWKKSNWGQAADWMQKTKKKNTQPLLQTMDKTYNQIKWKMKHHWEEGTGRRSVSDFLERLFKGTPFSLLFQPSDSLNQLLEQHAVEHT